MTPIAVTGAARDPALPGIPTIAEAGLPGYEATSWFALMLPAGVPAPVAARIEAAMRRVLADEALVNGWRQRGIAVGDRFGAAFESFAEAERIRWRDVITRGGITLG